MLSEVPKDKVNLQDTEWLLLSFFGCWVSFFPVLQKIIKVSKELFESIVLISIALVELVYTMAYTGYTTGL